MHEPEDLLLCPKRASRLDTGKPPPTFPPDVDLTSIRKGLEGTARDSLHYLYKILLYIFVIPRESD